ncbi:MAG TPA: 3'(2'),5'-bisphosphate nucleotidase CysQ [Bacteroidales bacterium]|nr:3'(2'),5'-bisphosphate nucleotidase CysQ [Bacteroidales bacterium]
MIRPEYDMAITAYHAGIRASEAIMKIYANPFGASAKADGSPITEADRLSNRIIADMLSGTGIPIISEESEIPHFDVRSAWEYFWLIDPLDGTREFVNRNGEFTVNIALLHNNRPLFGMILAPVLNKAWWGIAGEGAYRIEGLKKDSATLDLMSFSQKLPQLPAGEGISVGVSRSHMEAQTVQLLEQLRSGKRNLRMVEKGSSLKFCDLVEGTTDIYARYSTTSEWDTAAGHALLYAHGGEVFHITRHEPLIYNKKALSNPGFVAFARKEDSARLFQEFSF